MVFTLVALCVAVAALVWRLVQMQGQVNALSWRIAAIADHAGVTADAITAYHDKHCAAHEDGDGR